MAWSKVYWCVIFVSLHYSTAVFADSLVIHPIQDNTLYSNAIGAVSNGTGSYFFAGRTNAGQVRRGLLAFDIAASVPAGSTIQSVTLTLNMSRTIGGDVSVELHRVSANWGEGTSNANANEGNGAPSTTNDATWLHRFYPSTNWTNQGGDFSAVVSASTVVGGAGSYQWSSANMVNDVQTWLNNPISNFGWIVVGDEVNNGAAKRFNSREFGDSTVPQLSITFVAVPEPGTWVLIILAVIGGALAWRWYHQRLEVEIVIPD